MNVKMLSTFAFVYKTIKYESVSFEGRFNYSHSVCGMHCSSAVHVTVTAKR